MFSNNNKKQEKEQQLLASKKQHLLNMLDCPHFGLDTIEQKGTKTASVIIANTALHMKQNNIRSLTTATHSLQFINDIFTITEIKQ